MKQDKRIARVLKSIPALGAVFSIGAVFYYILVLSKGYYHSDCTDTILWAQAALDGHRLINSDFCYAALLPFGGQLLMLPWVAIWGVGMKAQLCGMALFAILFVAAIWWLARAMQWEKTWSAGLVMTILLTVSASPKLREIFWEHIIYYSFGVLTLLTGMAIVLRCERLASEKASFLKQLCLYGLFLVFTMFACANGMQSLTLYGLPVLAALTAERFFDLKQKLIARENLRRYLLILIMILGIAAGILLGKAVNHGVRAGYAEAYSSFSKSSDWVDNLLKFFPMMFELVGVKVSTNMLLFSGAGISNLLRILFAMILMVVPVGMAVRYRHFQDCSLRLLLLVHHFMAALLLMGWTFGKLNSACWRLSPLLVTSVMLCVCLVRHLLKGKEMARLAALLLVPFLMMGCLVGKDIGTLGRQTTQNAALTELIECLESNGLEYGYATFWQANVVTLLSDSRVKIRCVTIDEKGVKIRYYQTNRNWYTQTERGPVFVVYTLEEFEQYFREENYGKLLTTKDFVIVVYDEDIW